MNNNQNQNNMNKLEEKMLEKMTPKQREEFEDFKKECDLAGIDDKLESLMKWYYGTTQRFVSEVKEREDKSVNKRLFRSYVNLTVLNCLPLLTAISDFDVANDEDYDDEKKLSKEEVMDIINHAMRVDALKSATALSSCMVEIIKSQYTNIKSKIDEAYGNQESGE